MSEPRDADTVVVFIRLQRFRYIPLPLWLDFLFKQVFFRRLSSWKGLGLEEVYYQAGGRLGGAIWPATINGWLLRKKGKEKEERARGHAEPELGMDTGIPAVDLVP